MEIRKDGLYIECKECKENLKLIEYINAQDPENSTCRLCLAIAFLDFNSMYNHYIQVQLCEQIEKYYFDTYPEIRDKVQLSLEISHEQHMIEKYYESIKNDFE